MSREPVPVAGYGNPPKSGQFKKGQSGNPRGRPKGSRDFNTDLRDVLNKTVAVTENGKSKRVTAQRATLMRLREKALLGDHRAIDKLLDLARELNFDEWSRKAERALSQNEGDILQRFRASVLAEAGSGPEEGSNNDDRDCHRDAAVTDERP